MMIYPKYLGIRDGNYLIAFPDSHNMDERGFIVTGATASTALMLLFLLSPFINQSGSFIGLDGSPAIIDHGWNGLKGIGYTIGDILCHQESDRCFILNGNQMPICIRDTGLLLGLTIGLFACIPLGTNIGDGRFLLIGIALVAVTGIEWMAESFMGNMPAIRMISGIIAGIGAAFILGWLLYREK